MAPKPSVSKKEARGEARPPAKDKLLTLINMSKSQPSLDINKLAEAVNVKVDPTTIELLKNLNMQLILAAAASKQGEKQAESNAAAQLMDILTSKSSSKTEKSSHSTTDNSATPAKKGSSSRSDVNNLQQQSVASVFSKPKNSAGPTTETQIPFLGNDQDPPSTGGVQAAEKHDSYTQRSQSNPGFESQVSYDSNQSEPADRYEGLDEDRTDEGDELYDQSAEGGGMWKPPTPDGPPPDSPPEQGLSMAHEADFSLATPGVKAALMQMLQGQPSSRLVEDASLSPSQSLSYRDEGSTLDGSNDRGQGSDQSFTDNSHNSSGRDRPPTEHDSGYRQRNYGYDSERGSRPDLSSINRDRGPVMAMADRGSGMDGNSGYG